MMRNKTKMPFQKITMQAMRTGTRGTGMKTTGMALMNSSQTASFSLKT